LILRRYIVLLEQQDYPEYHLITTPSHRMITTINYLRSNFNNPAAMDFIEHIEPDYALTLLAQRLTRSTLLGTKFSLSSGASSHSDYLLDLDTMTARQMGMTGQGTVIVILDSGIDPGHPVSGSIKGYADMTQAGAAPRREDLHGHGTAMATIINDVAPGADLQAIRVTNKSFVFLWDLLAGMITAVLHMHANIISLSLGCRSLAHACSQCGGYGGSRSIVCNQFFDHVTQTGNSQADPIILAAAGNDDNAMEFDWPASFGSVIAVGAVTHAKSRSSFSTVGKSKILAGRNNSALPLRYILCPGGEIDREGNPVEWVGEGLDGNATTYCAGTSPATAYASGVFALQRQYIHLAGGSISSNQVIDKALTNARQLDIPNYNQAEHGYGRLVFVP
jgi:subtilisin family serine protease